MAKDKDSRSWLWSSKVGMEIGFLQAWGYTQEAKCHDKFDSEKQLVCLEGVLQEDETKGSVRKKSSNSPLAHQFRKRHSQARDSAGHGTYKNGKVIFFGGDGERDRHANN